MKYKTQRKKKNFKSENRQTAGTKSLSRTTRQQMMDHIVTSPYGKEKKLHKSKR